jgi:hypothetical protein
MDTIHAIIMAICITCGASGAAHATNHDSQECFASKHEALQEHPGGHVRWHTTPSGTCYHIGKRNHSGTWRDSKPLPTKDGSGSVQTAKKGGNPNWGKGSNIKVPFLDETREWFGHMEDTHVQRNKHDHKLDDFLQGHP